MHYFIDGYNLLFRIKTGDDLQKERDDIIKDLEVKVNFLKLHVTLVFDAHHQRSLGSRSHINCLEIFFTASKETADDFILRIIADSKKPAQQTIVTSDKKLSWLAQRSLAKVQTVEEFIKWLNRRYNNQRLKNLSPKTAEKKSTPSRDVAVQKKPFATKSKPDKEASPQNCLEYYLECFEKEFASTIQKEIKIKSRHSKKRKKTKPSSRILSINSSGISNEQRWFTAFQRNLDDDLVEDF